MHEMFLQLLCLIRNMKSNTKKLAQCMSLVEHLNKLKKKMLGKKIKFENKRKVLCIQKYHTIRTEHKPIYWNMLQLVQCQVQAINGLFVLISATNQTETFSLTSILINDEHPCIDLGFEASTHRLRDQSINPQRTDRLHRVSKKYVGLMLCQICLHYV